MLLLLTKFSAGSCPGETVSLALSPAQYVPQYWQRMRTNGVGTRSRNHHRMGVRLLALEPDKRFRPAASAAKGKRHLRLENDPIRRVRLAIRCGLKLFLLPDQLRGSWLKN